MTSRILIPTRGLLIEGMRQLDEWDRMRESLPSLDARVVFPDGLSGLTILDSR